MPAKDEYGDVALGGGSGEPVRIEGPLVDDLSRVGEWRFVVGDTLFVTTVTPQRQTWSEDAAHEG